MPRRRRASRSGWPLRSTGHPRRRCSCRRSLPTDHGLWVLAAAAAVLVIAAGLGGWAVGQREPGVPTGPPGTFGVTELISFTGEPRGVEIEASIVAHTWGTETVMTIDGLEQGTYTVQVVGTDGESVDSGTFIAPARGITDCRMIAALLRQEADIIVVSDSDGDVVMRSQLPETT